MSKPVLNELRLLIGLDRQTTSHNEKIISAFGGFLSITIVYWLTQLTLDVGIIDSNSHFLIIASMGASAVLLFAVPHGALSQPWAVFGGHLISAFIGISCYKLFGQAPWVAGLAVGGAIGAMYYLRCIHPPGGATALTGVIGSASVVQLGYEFMLVPILANVVAILLVAFLFNWAFGWRRYPAHLAHKLKTPVPPMPIDRQFELTQEDFAAAMQELDSYVDITTEGLTDLMELAKQHAERNTTHPDEIIPGHFYSNGKLGSLWSIRQVIDASPAGSNPQKDKVIYKVLAGAGDYETGICLRSELHQWARFEVIKHNNQWLKVSEED
ncbi:HPP family protein [Alteromonadaceae bacterium BrNp21-10]|nr:HPP family protein [Alteromonadaceae bacterium BrNp21-10]